MGTGKGGESIRTVGSEGEGGRGGGRKRNGLVTRVSTNLLAHCSLHDQRLEFSLSLSLSLSVAVIMNRFEGIC